MSLLNNTYKKLFAPELFQNEGQFSRKMMDKNYRTEVQNLLLALLKFSNEKILITEQQTRQFIATFHMMSFDLFDKHSTKDVYLYYKVKELHNEFHKIFNENLKSSTLFFKSFKIFLKTFDDWKKHDEKVILDKTCTQQYKEIQVMEQKFQDPNNPADEQFSSSTSDLKRVFEKRIQRIGGNRAMKYVNDSPKLDPLDVMHLDMEETMKKAFWDLFEQDIKENKLEKIGIMLTDFRKYLFELLGNSKRAQKIQEEFDDRLDLDLLNQMIVNNTLNTLEIFNIMKTLCHYVKNYVQSPSEDKDTEIFIENVYKKIEEQVEPLSHILRYFFQNLFIKLDKVKVQMEVLNL